MNPFSLTGHHALVTGSSRGIGHAIALGLHGAGAQVLFHGSTRTPSGMPAGATSLTCNLLEDGAPEALVRDAFKATPQLDLLVSNAGAFFDSPFLQMDESRWEKTFRLNVRSAYFLIRAFATEMKARNRPGSVVIVSSTNGFHPEADSTAYDISKGALVTMTRTLALALAPHRIRVNGVAPGLIRTDLTAWTETNHEFRRHYEKKILLGRVGEASECAGVTTFLLSSAASYMTGQVLIVDGGLTVGQIGTP